MVDSLWQLIVHFIILTFKPEVLWNIAPLIIATMVIIFYFQRYSEERQGWNTYLTNSLVLLFVSLNLLRYLYTLDSSGFYNFFANGEKTIAVIFLMSAGFILTRFNFEHILPEKFARYISSPIAVNLVAYAVILFVYSPLEPSWIALGALAVIVVSLSLILNLIKIPIRMLLKYMEKEKEKEKIKSVKEAEFQLKEMEKEVKLRKNELYRMKKYEVEHSKKFMQKLLRYFR